MRRRRSAAAWTWAIVAIGCAAPPAPRSIEVGIHRIRLAPPRGWEVLEHGEQAWVRRGELAISISDLGPATAADEPAPAPHAVAARVLGRSSQASRREIARGGRRSIHGREWADLETWDRVSHMNRSRIAFLASGGHLLAIAIERGPIEETGPAFEAVLTSVEVASPPDSTETKSSQGS